MMLRRIVLVAAILAPVVAVAQSQINWKQPLPDATFVGFAGTVNAFETQSGQLALQKSTNELTRGFATRAVQVSTDAGPGLTRNAREAGVTGAPHEEFKKIADGALARLNTLSGADFDKAYADAQLLVWTAVVDQYGAYGENTNNSAPLRRYAQEQFPKAREALEYAKRLQAGK